MVAILGEEDKPTRLRAIDSLAKMGDRRALKALRKCTRAKDPAIREAASSAIERIRHGDRPVYYITN